MSIGEILMHIEGSSRYSGRLVCRRDVVIRGAFHGELMAQRVFLLRGASFSGTLQCSALLVQGYMDAQVECRSTCILLPGALLCGTVRCAGVAMSGGALINAHVAVSPATSRWHQSFRHLYHWLEQGWMKFRLRRIAAAESGQWLAAGTKVLCPERFGIGLIYQLSAAESLAAAALDVTSSECTGS